MARYFSLFCILACLATPSWAAVPPSHKPIHKAVKRSVAVKKPHVQQHYSFLPPPKPITGRITQQHTLAPVVMQPPALPVAPLAIIQKPISPDNQLIQTSRKHPGKPHSPQFWNPWIKLAQALSNKTGIQERSWVSDINPRQAQQLAQAIADFVANELPPETTTLLLASPARGQARNTLTPALQEALRKSGFALATSEKQMPQTKILRYQVNRLDSGLLLRLSFNQHEVSRVYHLTESNTLVTNTPFSVRLQGEP